MGTEGVSATREVRLARLILQYLSRHPQAKDTREGIAAWWVQQQLIEEAVQEVFRALELLVACDLIVERCGPDSRACYEINPERIGEIACFVRESDR